jgi:hypothetical protein
VHNLPGCILGGRESPLSKSVGQDAIDARLEPTGVSWRRRLLDKIEHIIRRAGCQAIAA